MNHKQCKLLDDLQKAEMTKFEDAKPIGQGRTRTIYDMESQQRIEQAKWHDNQLMFRNKLISLK